MSGFKLFMTQPKSYDGRIDSGLQEVHGGGVPENVRGDSFRSKTGTSRRRSLKCGFENVRDTIAGEDAFAGIWKRNVIWETAGFGKPGTKNPSRVRPERNLAILSTFTVKMDRSARAIQRVGEAGLKGPQNISACFSGSGIEAG